MDIWQPIETAPKDGTVIDLWVSSRRRCPDCFWETEWGEPGEWRQKYAESNTDFSLFEIPTHWAPPPNTSENNRLTTFSVAVLILLRVISRIAPGAEMPRAFRGGRKL